MDQLRYLDFDLDIERSDNGYRIEVNSPAGQADGAFVLPFSNLEIENALLRFGRPQRGTRSVESAEAEAARAFGARLFGTVFDGEVRSCLRSSIEEARRQDAGLRIRLRLNSAPELTDLPWEFLYNPALNRFLALSSQTPLVRFLELPERVRPLAIAPPLRILAVIASPRGYPPLDVEREWRNLNTALADLEGRGIVTVERLPAAQLPVLQRQLRRSTYHVLHFVGHGTFDERAQDGEPVLEDAEGYGVRVSSRDLGIILHDHGSLRLAVLNACEGGRSSRSDPFAGAAQSLIQQGIPAVIAMQFPVTDNAAITFSGGFYGALGDGYPVDGAIAEARKELLASGNGVEWGTPVLYMRAPDGQIFNLVAAPAIDPQHKRAADLMREAEAAIGEQHWAVASEKLRVILALAPDHVEAQRLLRHAQQQQNLAVWYNQGRKHVAAGRWPEAFELFGRVRAIDPHYRNVGALLGAIEQEIERSAGAKHQPAAPAEKSVDAPAPVLPAGPPVLARPATQPPEAAQNPQAPARHTASQRRIWAIVGAVAALAIMLIVGVLFVQSRTADRPQPTAAAAALVIASTSMPATPPAPTLDSAADVAAPVAQVDAGTYMVLVGQLEPLGATKPDSSKTQLLFNDLKHTYEVDNTRAKLQIRATSAMLRSPEDARAAAEANQAIIVVWGNYSDSQMQVHIDIGSLKPFPSIPFARDVLERTSNLTVRLDDPRQQSIAPQVLTVDQWIVSAAGDIFAVARNAELLNLMDITSAEPERGAIATQAYQALRLYYTDTAHAIETLNAVLEQDAKNPLLLALRSLSYVRENKFAESLQDATSAAALDPSGKWPAPSVIQGFVAVLSGNYDQASAVFGTAIKLQPNDWFTTFLRGYTAYLRRDNVGSRSDLERSIQLGPEASYPYLTLIMLDLREGRAADAKALLAIVKQRFRDPDIGVRQMRALFAEQGSQSLFSLLLKAAGNLADDRFPDVISSTADGLALLAQLSQAQTAQAPETIRNFQTMIADLSFERGIAQCNLAQYADAEKSYSDALAVDPDFALVYLLRAEVRAKQQNAAGAAEDVAAAQQSRLGPSLEPLIAAKTDQLSCETLLRP